MKTVRAKYPKIEDVQVEPTTVDAVDQLIESFVVNNTAVVDVADDITIRVLGPGNRIGSLGRGSWVCASK
jgi:hypothetical protein